MFGQMQWGLITCGKRTVAHFEKNHDILVVGRPPFDSDVLICCRKGEADLGSRDVFDFIVV